MLPNKAFCRLGFLSRRTGALVRREPLLPLPGHCCKAGLTGGRCASRSPEEVQRAGLTGSGLPETSGSTGLSRLAPAQRKAEVFRLSA